MKEVRAKYWAWFVKQWRYVKTNWRNTDEPMALGLAWSKAFVALLLVLALVPYSSGEAGWELKIWTLIKSPPNEIGDTLAGIAGALAFLWIIVTVQLQSRELRAQREELELARKEYAKMAEAQDVQSKVLSEELALRREANAGHEANVKSEALAKKIRECLLTPQDVLLSSGTSMELRLIDHTRQKNLPSREFHGADVKTLLSWFVTSIENVHEERTIEGPLISDTYRALDEYLEVLSRTGPTCKDKLLLEVYQEQFQKLKKMIGKQ